MKKQITKMHEGATPQIFNNAKELRKNMIPAEQELWETLRNKQLDGLKFRRQHPINKYVLDFYCHKAKLGIELDGEYHEEKGQQFYDNDRTANLKELKNIHIIRFSNREVFDNLERVLDTIRKKAKTLLQEEKGRNIPSNL